MLPNDAKRRLIFSDNFGMGWTYTGYSFYLFHCKPPGSCVVSITRFNLTKRYKHKARASHIETPP